MKSLSDYLYYEEDGIQIYCGDCLEIMPLLPKVDLVVTDPPYGINYQSNMRVVSDKFAKIEGDNDLSRLESFNIVQHLMKDNTVLVSFCSYKNYAEDYIHLNKILSIKNVIIWHKPGGGIGDLEHTLSTDYEMVIVSHKGQRKINGKRIGSVWTISKVNPNKMVHPTEKPWNAMGIFLNYFSNKGELVLDYYLGSGTTLVACKELGRKGIGIEVNEKYCEIAKNRLKNCTKSLF